MCSGSSKLRNNIIGQFELVEIKHFNMGGFVQFNDNFNVLG